METTHHKIGRKANGFFDLFFSVIWNTWSATKHGNQFL
jgi:hypothetical protein